jgi:hypothetical protein
MRKLILVLFLGITILGCSETEPGIYTGNDQTFQLYKSSDFEFSGIVEVKELIEGGLEFNISLEGPKGDAGISYPAHLHFGGIDEPDVIIAAMLSTINSVSLKSNTLITKLSDGTNLDFESFQSFHGHIKVHLAAEGPDYKTILVSGHVGNISIRNSDLDRSKIAVCGNSF